MVRDHHEIVMVTSRVLSNRIHDNHDDYSPIFGKESFVSSVRVSLFIYYCIV